MSPFRYIVLVLLFLFATPQIFAKENRKVNVLVFGVMDDATYNPLTDLEFSITSDVDDSVAVDSVISVGQSTYKVFITVPDGHYNLVVEKDGYFPFVKPFIRTGRIGYIGLGTIFMTQMRRKQLNEVTVTATRVKMVMHGDTIVYDAGAFELAEGSMLDALVAQLPGTELKDGRISVNGKFVESLLVNGEDFFSGNAKVALRNLPSYTVKNIKVYDREARDAYLRGGKRKSDPEHIVMDVILKKEYSYGGLGNVEGGYGTHGRYLGKAFGMGYADNMRLAAYANFNNVNETESGNTGGGWGGGWQQDGDMDLKMGGIDYLWTKHDFRFSGNVMLTGEDPDVQTKQSTVNYYEAGDVYGRSFYRSREHKFHLLSFHQWSWSGKHVYAQLKPSVDYMRNDYERTSRRASFDRPLTESYRGEALDSLFGGSTSFLRNMLSRVGNTSAGKTDWLKIDVTGSTTIAIPGYNDNIYLAAGYNYRRDTDRPDNAYSRISGLASDQAGEGTSTLQEKDYESLSQKAFGSMSYTWWYTPYYGDRNFPLIITPRIDFAYADDTKDNVLRQLIEDLSDPLLSPSATNGGRLPLDVANSYNSRLTSMSYKPGVHIQFEYHPSARSPHALAIHVDISADVKAEKLNYEKGEYVDLLKRTTTFLNPQFNAKYTRQTDNSDTELLAIYSFMQSAPSLMYRLKTSDTSNPTAIYLNNPDLGNSRTNSASLRFNRFWKRTHRSINANVSYSQSDNTVAQARYYDRNTGVSTWRPENIDGNRNLNGNVGYTVPFGKNEAFQFSGNTSAGYVNSVDYASETEVLTRSVVRNLSIGQQAGFSYRVGQHSFGINGGVSWQHAKSQIHLFETINALLCNARANCLLNFAYGWQVATDLNLYARRGYSDNTLNTTDWVWNASLSKTFLKGQLTAKVEAVDILGQVSSVRNIINAQGRTETWVNSLPRYAMAHLIYRFNIMPKKK